MAANDCGWSVPVKLSTWDFQVERPKLRLWNWELRTELKTELGHMPPICQPSDGVASISCSRSYQAVSISSDDLRSLQITSNDFNYFTIKIQTALRTVCVSRDCFSLKPESVRLAQAVSAEQVCLPEISSIELFRRVLQPIYTAKSTAVHVSWRA